jgi:hypothetical protein
MGANNENKNPDYFRPDDSRTGAMFFCEHDSSVTEVARCSRGPGGNAAAASAAAPEPHPEIREAIEALRRARGHLEHAAHDFGGHRVEAIKSVDESLHQLQDCLRYDKD